MRITIFARYFAPTLVVVWDLYYQVTTQMLGKVGSLFLSISILCSHCVLFSEFTCNCYFRREIGMMGGGTGENVNVMLTQRFHYFRLYLESTYCSHFALEV